MGHFWPGLALNKGDHLPSKNLADLCKDLLEQDDDSGMYSGVRLPLPKP